LELLDILPNSPILVLEASKFGPNLVLNILGIELLFEFPLESIPSGDTVGSSLYIITPTTPPNEGYIFKGEGNVVYLLGFILDAYCCKLGSSPQKKFSISLAFLAPLEVRGQRALPFGVVDTWVDPPLPMLATMAMQTLSCASKASILTS